MWLLPGSGAFDDPVVFARGFVIVGRFGRKLLFSSGDFFGRFISGDLPDFFVSGDLFGSFGGFFAATRKSQ